jgi:hypothetical protein
LQQVHERVKEFLPISKLSQIMKTTTKRKGERRLPPPWELMRPLKRKSFPALKKARSENTKDEVREAYEEHQSAVTWRCASNFEPFE